MRWPTRRPASSRDLIRLLAVVSLALVVAALLVPRVLSDGHRAPRGRDCDRLFHASDQTFRDLARPMGMNARAATAALLAGADERNPRDHHARLLVQSFDPGFPGFVERAAIQSCQIEVTPLGERAVLLRQARTELDEGGSERSVRVELD